MIRPVQTGVYGVGSFCNGQKSVWCGGQLRGGGGGGGGSALTESTGTACFVSSGETGFCQILRGAAVLKDHRGFNGT